MIWPADIAVHVANVKDAFVFEQQLSKRIPKQLLVLLADGGYDQDSCYEICDAEDVSLIAPIRVKKTRQLNVRSVHSFIKILTRVRFLLYARPRLNLSKVSLNPYSTWRSCL